MECRLADQQEHLRKNVNVERMHVALNCQVEGNGGFYVYVINDQKAVMPHLGQIIQILKQSL